MNNDWNYESSDSQCAAIREHLIEKGSITQMEALHLFGCMRLASRIHDLRDSGMKIETERTERITSQGKKKHFATYRFSI